MVNTEELEFEMAFHPQTSEYNSDSYTLFVPFDLHEGADETDEGRFYKIPLYEEEVKRLFQLCCQQECVKQMFHDAINDIRRERGKV